MIPEGWRRETLRNLVEGCDYGLSCPLSTSPEGIPILRMGNVREGRVSLDDLKYAPASLVREEDFLQRYDLLLNRTNSQALVGRVGLFNLADRVTFASYLFRLRAVRGVEPGWLAQVLASPSYQTLLRSIATPGVSQANINRNALLELSLWVPQQLEQQKIAAILSSIDDALAASQTIVAQLHALKAAMLAELLTQGLPGRDVVVSGGRGGAPQHWQRTTVGELATFSGGNGFTPKDWSTKGLPIIRIQNLNGSVDFNYYDAPPQDDWLVYPGDLLFAWAGSRGASFGPCVWPGPIGVLNQHIYRIHPNAKVTTSFLYYVLRLLTADVEKRAHGFKDTLVHLRKFELTGWPVALPPMDEQEEIVRVLGSVDTRLTAEHDYLQSLQTFRAALSTALLTGEIRVPLSPQEASTP